ncbi:hypothetical protein QE152_g29155 [Popillia japonica]|uniref:Uncharacterized protein n=1 Tax=Popillia japonica TaxID=7064 RepID=A0AAW1JK45_POPJA
MRSHKKRLPFTLSLLCAFLNCGLALSFFNNSKDLVSENQENITIKDSEHTDWSVIKVDAFFPPELTLLAEAINDLPQGQCQVDATQFMNGVFRRESWAMKNSEHTDWSVIKVDAFFPPELTLLAEAINDLPQGQCQVDATQFMNGVFRRESWAMKIPFNELTVNESIDNCLQTCDNPSDIDIAATVSSQIQDAEEISQEKDEEEEVSEQPTMQ